MDTIIILTLGILTLCGYPNIIDTLNSFTTTYETEASTDTFNSEADYTTGTEKDNIIKAINDVDLDYLFSLKLEQLTNNFEGEYSFSDYPLSLIYPSGNLKKISLDEKDRYTFYFDDANNVNSIESYDLEKILGIEKPINNFDDIQNILGKNQVVSIKTKYKYNNHESTDIALIYDIDKYSYIFLSGDIDGTYCRVLICKTEDKKLGEISKVEKEFRNDLPDIIISQKDKISKFFEDASNNWYEVTDNYIIIDMAEGDLNNDTKSDFAVVVQQENTYMLYDALRWIYIFEQNNDGSYTLSHLNKNIVLNVLQGGPFGDPFDGISIEDGILSIKDYGGSSSKWGHTYNFGYDNNDFILKKYISIGNDVISGNVDTYDFENLIGTLTIYGENIPPENETILQFSLDNERTYFDNLVSDEMFLKDFHLPTFGDNPFYPNFPEFKISAQEALDNIKNLYYSDMEKVYIPWTEETKKNYSQALGYEAPDYYYKNDEAILSYYQIKNSNIIIEHAIIYEGQGSSSINSKSYYISTSTGATRIGG